MNTKFLIAFALCFISLTSISQQLEMMILENWNDGVWENRMRELPTYSEEERLIEKEIAHWDVDANQWVDQSKTEWKRDEDGILLSRESFKWNTDISMWEASLKVSFSVNDLNKPSSILTEAKNENGWYNQSIDEYDYDAKGDVVKKQLSRWNMNSQSWVPYRKYEYRRENGQTTGYTISFWDANVNEWQFYKKATYSYSEEKKVDHIVFESWIDEQWQNHSVRRNFRKEDGTMETMEVDLFADEIEEWEKSSHVDYEFTDFGKIATSTSKKWQSEHSSWRNLQRSSYFYTKDGEMLSEWTEVKKEMELFPNPASERLTIRTLPIGTLTIQDALGKIVFQTENSANELQMDVSKWEIGVYSVRVDGNEVRQFVKQ